MSELIAKMIAEKPNECWDWPGYLSEDGYGTVRDGSIMDKAHRVAFRRMKGPIPEGLHIDHLCRNKRCFNPYHLEAVTQAENNRRRHAAEAKTHCPRGHPYAGENLRMIRKANGGQARFCNECCRIRNREAQWKKRREAGVPQRKQAPTARGHP